MDLGTEERVNPGSGRRKRPKVPPDQRKRVRIACEFCRRNKLRCDGQKPCSRCAGAGAKKQRSCEYIVRPTSSSPLPTLPADVEARDRERLGLLEDIFANLHPDISTDADSLRNLNLSFESRSSPAHPPDTTQGHLEDVREDVERRDREHWEARQTDTESLVLASTPMPTASTTVINQGKTHFEGRFSYWTFFNSVRQVVTENDAEAGENDEADCDNSIHQVSISNLPADWKTAVLSSMPPRDVVDFLVTTFFRSAQANHFYIHPEIFSRKLTAFYNGTHEFDNHNSSNSRRSVEFISVLFMVFAIGSQFAELETDRVDGTAQADAESFSQSDTVNRENLDFSQYAIPVPSPSPGWRFYEVSRRLLSDVICMSSMASVQVCVLQGIFLPSTKSRDAGYNLLGLALRMAINMGLHRSFTGSSLHPHVRELRNRLWWSVYVAERLFSVEMGRPLSINDAEIDAPFPVDMPDWGFPPGSGRATNVDNLIAMAKLCRLLGKIVEAIYCRPPVALLSSHPEGSTTIIQPKVFRELKRELEQSRRDLPPQLRLGSSPSRSVTHIALTYEQATILLTRSCLNYAHVAATNSSGSVGREAMRFLQQQAQDCVNAAVASIRLLSSLRTRALLSRFSFHDSLYCTAALYVLLLGEKLDWLVDTTDGPIVQGILVLLDLAKGSESAANALKYIIPAFQAFQKGNPKRTFSFVENNMLDEETRRERGRRAWKAWMAGSNPPSSAEAYSGSLNTQETTGLGSTNADRVNISVGSQFNLSSPTNPNLDSPTVIGEHTSGIFDVQPFWITDNADFNILSRDLTGVPSMPDFGLGQHYFK